MDIIPRFSQPPQGQRWQSGWNARFLKKGLKPLLWMRTKPLFFLPEIQWAILYATGFVVIYANPSLESEERAELKTVAGSGYFDLDALNLPADDADAAQQVLLLAESLRIANERQG